MRNFVVLAVLMLAGCYKPSLSSPGFYCHSDDNPACPDGQACIANRCVNISSSSLPPTPDMFGSDGGACKGKGVMCSKSTECCSFTCSPTDGCTDMVCTQLGLSCTDSAKCCSNYCSPSGACATMPGTCSANGVQCATGATCCSAFCSQFSTCAAKSTACGESGAPCSTDNDCCTDTFCDTFDGSPYSCY